ncbi:MAG: response regulator [Aphanocapsa sp. GSE-SYN-MK-11-07L]|jgi:DNA-binding response OmpR family regulator/HPt (histidine-containing phosphotransfer) domain-containing protein|nr:response regulator [Aphanocapsa sp. GSE-SYN-MK-11-07L]
MKILLVEDDEALVTILTKNLVAHHHAVDIAKDGEMGWTFGSTFEYDLIVLDIMLPKLDGISLCQRFRAEGYTTPILLLTAQDTSTAKVRGLDAGADDYVVKPFDVAELTARIRALLRRSSANPLPLLTWGELLLNPSTCEVSYNSQPLALTTKEYELLELLLRDSQHVYGTEEILDRLWSSEDFPAEATVRSHIRRLRHKLTDSGAPADFIATVHGRGYYLKAPQPEPSSTGKDFYPGDRTAQSTQSGQPRSSSTELISQAELEQQAQYLACLNETWMANRPKSLTELEVLAKAATILQAGLLDAQLRSQAHQIAHKLAGTLGTFGLTQSMHLARQLEHLFAPQQRLQSQQAAEIKTLVEALEHEIQTTQSIQTLQIVSELPGRFPNGNVARTVLPNAQRESPSQTVAGAKVMIVDDDQDWLRTLPALLKPWEFKITTLAEPQQFWLVLQAVMPDLLVLDVNMPTMNGFELCQSLRNDPSWRRLPVVFLSVLTDSQTQNQAFMVGADDYLCKPVLGLHLANRILNRLQRVQSWAN